MPDLPRFTFFDDPVRARSIVRSDASCECCGESRGWMHGQSPGLCPWCIASGAAMAKIGRRFNHFECGDTSEQHKEVAERTPSIYSWQDLWWPVCCEQPCVFLGFGDHEALTRIWPGAGEAFLASYETGWLGTKTAAEFLEFFDGGGEGDPECYIFRCTTCAKFHVPWDCS